MARRKREPREVQGELAFRRWGGAREGAGRRPKGEKAGVRHAVREGVVERHPLLVTLRVCKGLPSLRRRGTWRVVEACMRRACERFGVRIVHFSVQTNHVHLMVEAPERLALARAMKGLGVRIARNMNKTWRRKGRVLADRYHHRPLRTPREVRNALSFVLNNLRRHVASALGLDRCSSAWWFDGWREAPGVVLALADGGPARSPPVATARTWLLGVGWRRHGLVSASEVPGPRAPGVGAAPRERA